MKLLPLRFLPLSIGLAFVAGSTFAAETKAAPPNADQILRGMSARLSSAPALTFHARRHSHGVVVPGKDAPEDAQVWVAVKRPSELVAKTKSRGDERETYFNGRTLTVHDVTNHFYASAPLHTSIDGMLLAVERDFGFRPPLAELASSDIYADIRHRVQAVKYLGTGRAATGFLGLSGVECHRLLLSGKVVDAELWVGKQDELPRQLVVTLKAHPERPRLTATIDQWNLAPKFTAQEFQFQPPAGTRKVPMKTSAEVKQAAKKRAGAKAQH